MEAIVRSGRGSGWNRTERTLRALFTEGPMRILASSPCHNLFLFYILYDCHVYTVYIVVKEDDVQIISTKQATHLVIARPYPSPADARLGYWLLIHQMTLARLTR